MLKQITKQTFTVFSVCIFAISGCSDNAPKEQHETQAAQKIVTNDPLTKTESDTTPTNAVRSESIFLTNAFAGKNSEKHTNFSCEDKIYLVIQFDNHPSKLHQINISWKDPHGEEREHNQFPYFITEKQAFAWSALKLHRSVGAGMLQWINPAAGMEEFIGEWTANIKIKNVLDKQIKFDVLC